MIQKNFNLIFIEMSGLTFLDSTGLGACMKAHRAMQAKETSDVIAEKAREKERINMLFEDGLRLVLSGVTTFEELKRIPRGDYQLKSVEEIIRTAEGRY